MTIAALAAVAGVAAIALGLWAFVSSVRAQDDAEVARSAPIDGAAQAISLLSKPSTERIPLEGSQADASSSAVGVGGRGVLVLDGLAIAPAGRTYQAWVVDPKARPLAHAPRRCSPASRRSCHSSSACRRGWVVGVTMEPEGGVLAPTERLRFAARRPSRPAG